MKIELTSRQEVEQAKFKRFVDTEVVPHADRFHEEEQIPLDMIHKLARAGYFGAILPETAGGRSMDAITYGLMLEQIGRGCSSLRSLVTVQSMVLCALERWGTIEQKNQWLPRIISGECVAAFALSEPNVGSDASSIEATAFHSPNSFIVNGTKKWITYGQIADVFLVFARCEDGPAAFLIERTTPGISIRPTFGLLGVRATMVAEVQFEQCIVSERNLVGRIGYGLSHVASTAISHGQYCVAWGCVGIAQACLDASLRYASERKQFGVYLRDHQLIRQMITNMIVKTKAARLLCYQAGYLRDIKSPANIPETSIAKYYASVVATEAANTAVSIHGGAGCSREHPVQRYLGDAKVMEIIEGSIQLHQIGIADFGYQEYTTTNASG